MKRQSSQDGLDANSVVMGTVYGLIVGAITALLTLPVSGIALRRSLTDVIELARPRDPIADSLAEGKAVARRRLEDIEEELGG